MQFRTKLTFISGEQLHNVISQAIEYAISNLQASPQKEWMA